MCARFRAGCSQLVRPNSGWPCALGLSWGWWRSVEQAPCSASMLVRCTVTRVHPSPTSLPSCLSACASHRFANQQWQGLSPDQPGCPLSPNPTPQAPSRSACSSLWLPRAWSMTWSTWTLPRSPSGEPARATASAALPPPLCLPPSRPRVSLLACLLQYALAVGAAGQFWARGNRPHSVGSRTRSSAEASRACSSAMLVQGDAGVGREGAHSAPV